MFTEQDANQNKSRYEDDRYQKGKKKMIASFYMWNKTKKRGLHVFSVSVWWHLHIYGDKELGYFTSTLVLVFTALLKAKAHRGLSLTKGNNKTCKVVRERLYSQRGADMFVCLDKLPSFFYFFLFDYSKKNIYSSWTALLCVLRLK